MYTASITVDAIIEALAVFLTPFVAPGLIVRAQANRTPFPTDPCAVLTELITVDLSKPWMEYDGTTEQAFVQGPARSDIQIDFYGPTASEQCKAVKSAFASPWGVAQFPPNIVPLYTGDGLQAPMISGEQQWESRWTLTVSLQYNPTIEVPQQFGLTLSPTIAVPVDS